MACARQLGLLPAYFNKGQQAGIYLHRQPSQQGSRGFLSTGHSILPSGRIHKNNTGALLEKICNAEGCAGLPHL